MVSSVFQMCFISVSDACLICFQTYVTIVASDILKLDRVLHLPPRLSAVSPRCQAWEGGGGGGPHWRGRAPCACGWTQQARRERAGAGRETEGSCVVVRTGRPDASHALFHVHDST